MLIDVKDCPNVALTGVPRSGTTLCCFLLNKLPNTVALHEPMDVGQFPQLKDQEAVCDRIGRFFDESRRSILTRGTALSKHRGQKVPDNPVGDQYFPTSGLREGGLDHGQIRIAKPVTPELLLVVKHPAAFTALLPTLHRRLPTFAVIRNPLAILSSWNSVNFAHRTGHAPAAENIEPRLKIALAAIEDAMQRQLYLLHWFFDQYASVLPEQRIIRYENIVATGGRALSTITPAAAALAEPLRDKNTNPLYSRARMQTLGQHLLASEGAYWHFYARDSVRQLLEDCGAG